MRSAFWFLSGLGWGLMIFEWLEARRVWALTHSKKDGRLRKMDSVE